MKRSQKSHSSFTNLAKNREQRPPASFREALGLKNRTQSQINAKTSRRTQAKQHEVSCTDSQSSEASCLDKKFYRCGCLNHNKGGCGHQYQNYLAQLREKRLRKRASSLVKQSQVEDTEQLQLSQQEAETRLTPFSTAKGSKLLKILEQSEQAQNSKSKLDYSISITIGKRIYFKKMKNKEQLLGCFAQIEKLIEGKL